MKPKQKYQKIIDRIKKVERPIIFVNGLTHGDEKMGKVVIDELEKLKIENGTLITNIANEKAFGKGIRYIEHDVNRVAPGKKDGSYEEQVSYYLSLIAEKVDVFIDIHSTESSLKDALIFTKISEEAKKIIDIVNPKIVLIMEATGIGAPLSYAKIGVAFEYGNDSDPVPTRKVIEDIKNILFDFKMISENVEKAKNQTEVFLVKKYFQKPEGANLADSIENLRLVKEGEVVAFSSDKSPIFAKEDFYPVLFSQNGYEEIFGFMGEKVE